MNKIIKSIIFQFVLNICVVLIDSVIFDINVHTGVAIMLPPFIVMVALLVVMNLNPIRVARFMETFGMLFKYIYVISLLILALNALILTRMGIHLSEILGTYFMSMVSLMVSGAIKEVISKLKH